MATNSEAHGLARLTALLADETRAAFCLALLDGRAWTATELARHAGVASSTASEQLTKLVNGGLLTEWRQGRHRYLALAGPSVAELLEDLSIRLGDPAGPTAVPMVATRGPKGRVPAGGSEPGRPASTPLRVAAASAAMRRGRTCYDHLAGQLGVSITDAMTTAGMLDQDAGFALTPAGVQWFAAELGINDLDRGGRRALVRGCIDWTERRPHLAGEAGARLCSLLFDKNWIVRIGTARAVKLTPAGRSALPALLPLAPDWDVPADVDRVVIGH